MNNSMKILIKSFTEIMTAALISLLSLQVFAEPIASVKSTVFTVNGMVCAFCAQGIEKKLFAMPQTQAVYVSLEEKIVAVEAKSGQTIDTSLVTAEIKDAGYDVSKVETVDSSVAAIKQSIETKQSSEGKQSTENKHEAH